MCAVNYDIIEIIEIAFTCTYFCISLFYNMAQYITYYCDPPIQVHQNDHIHCNLGQNPSKSDA